MRSVTRASVAVAGLLAVALTRPVSPLARQAAPQLPSYKAGVDVVALSVTVTDASGRYVTDLTPEQLRVFEDGAPQDIAYFNRTNVPIALALLLDTSSSMEGKIAIAQEAAIGFVRRLRPLDLGELIAFAHDVKVVQGFTSDQAALELAVRGTAPGGTTALRNAIYISLKELKKVRAPDGDAVRRQAIVVFTDGDDTSSLVGHEDVLDLARRSETAIYTIGLRTEFEVAQRTYSEADVELRQLAQETGGRAFFCSRIEELAGVYGRIADELASQYTVGYTSTNGKRDGAWRRVTVRVDRAGVTARSRLGYFGPGRR
jgi:Ca-activated chloride channel homolog